MSEERTNISDSGKMLTVKEYAIRHGNAERTVEKWCEQNLLPGAIREKLKGGTCRYRYLIPENAVPKRLTLAQTVGKPEMLSPTEYASMTGRSRKTVLRWCLYGMLEGVEKIPSGSRFHYLIPRDAQPMDMKKQKREEAEMLTVQEYARRHRFKKNTVTYWCRQNMLPGAVRVPANRGGFCGYYYMIPANALPTYQTPGFKRPKGMLTSSEYAEKMGVKIARVLKWCEKGQLKGIRKVPYGQGYRYMIPEDAELEKRYYPHEREAQPPKPKPEKPPEPPKPQKVWTEREISLHIMRYCGTRTYQQLSNDLGLSVAEVRRRYDRLHEIHGV